MSTTSTGPPYSPGMDDSWDVSLCHNIIDSVKAQASNESEYVLSTSDLLPTVLMLENGCARDGRASLWLLAGRRR